MEHHPRMECSSENERTTNYTYQQASRDESHNHSGEQQAKRSRLQDYSQSTWQDTRSFLLIYPYAWPCQHRSTQALCQSLPSSARGVSFQTSFCLRTRQARVLRNEHTLGARPRPMRVTSCCINTLVRSPIRWDKSLVYLLLWLLTVIKM